MTPYIAFGECIVCAVVLHMYAHVCKLAWMRCNNSVDADSLGLGEWR